MSDGPPLSRGGYDRAALHRTDDDWVSAAWEQCRVVAVTTKSAVPTDGSSRIVFRTPSSIPSAAPRRLLGVVDDVPYFSATVEADASDTWLTLREFGGRADDVEAALVVSAIALEQWHQRHPRCPLCGSATVEAQAGWIRTCVSDGSHHFPRTDPAVIMLIHDGGDQALLGRGPQWGEGRFSTLAGFVEPGESLEAAVAREVFEEVGVTITDIRYIASQPWPFPASLMVGFIARLDGSASLSLDPVEMADAGWFTRDEIRQARDWTDDLAAPAEGTARLRAIPPHLSISRHLIDLWLDS